MAFVGSAFRNFWHTMTSYDRHFDGKSPYRTGQHVPLPQSRHAPLTSVATSASESRQDINSPYFEEHVSLDGAAQYPPSPYPQSPGPHSPSPYSLGMRSTSALRRTATNDQFENATQGEIQMQSFQEGLPPAPPVSHSWKRIDRWAEENYEELFDQLCEGCTNNDLNELEHQLDCSLPMEVRESLQYHDGQERGGLPTGIIFGCMLLDCEEMVQEWENWKKVNSEYLAEPLSLRPTVPPKTHNSTGDASPGASGSKHAGAKQAQNPMWRQDLLSKQDSVPANAIQKVYAHPAWIPMVRDWGGNNLAVDLAPGPAGRWGQVILFGRDYDRKYVVARSWSAFVATVADDLGSGRWFVDDETGELKLREFKSNKIEPGYFDILRWRVDERYKRMSAGHRKSVAAGGGSPNGSPYASPTTDVGHEPRGRSMQRFRGASPVQSPNRTSYAGAGASAMGSGKSPLGKVPEEANHHGASGSVSSTKPTDLGIETSLSVREKLVEVDTPRVVVDSPTATSAAGVNGDASGAGLGLPTLASDAKEVVGKNDDGDVDDGDGDENKENVERGAAVRKREGEEAEMKEIDI